MLWKNWRKEYGVEKTNWFNWQFKENENVKCYQCDYQPHLATTVTNNPIWRILWVDYVNTATDREETAAWIVRISASSVSVEENKQGRRRGAEFLGGFCPPPSRVRASSLGERFHTTICQRSYSYPFYKLTYHLKWVTTSWPDSITFNWISNVNCQKTQTHFRRKGAFMKNNNKIIRFIFWLRKYTIG